MAERIRVPEPDHTEELRQLAEVVADLHYVIGIVVENAPQLVPGEAVDELKGAWTEARQSIAHLVEALSPTAEGSQEKISYATISKGQLTGEVGRAKKSLCRRLKERFLMFWNSEPRTDEKRAQAGDALEDYLEFGATLVSSIPGHEKVVELLSLIKQLVGLRKKRGV